MVTRLLLATTIDEKLLLGEEAITNPLDPDTTEVRDLVWATPGATQAATAAALTEEAHAISGRLLKENGS